MFAEVTRMSHAAKPIQDADTRPRRRRRRRKRRRLDFSTLHPDQNLDEYEVAEFLRISRSNLRSKIYPASAYYDPSFPAPHGLRGEAKRGRAVRWKAGLIIEWNRSQPSCSYGAKSR